MGVGLSLTKLTPLVNNSFKVDFKTVKNIVGARGITNLANSYLFFILSAFNPVEKTGSNLTKVIGTGLVYQTDTQATVVEINDIVDDATERFKFFQTNAFQKPSPDETLQSANILSIEVDAKSSQIIVSLEIINILGEKARLEF